jgi:universal stress protein A
VQIPGRDLQWRGADEVLEIDPSTTTARLTGTVTMNISLCRILFPTDFSDASKEAEAYAVALANRFGAELHLLHVVSQVMPYTDASSTWVLPDNETQLQLEMAEKRLLERVPASECSNETRVLRTTVVGFAIDQILAYATKHEIDLIVVGTHGYSWLAHTLIGSVAEKLVRMATCPVLTVHPKGRQFVVESVAGGVVRNLDRAGSVA